MKSFSLLLATFCFILLSCSNGSEKFSGTWQSVHDPSKQITITLTGKTYTVSTTNFESSLEGLTGTFNADKDALEFDKGNGDISIITYNATTNHIIGLGNEFEKATGIVTDNGEAEPTPEKTTEAASAEDQSTEANDVAENKVNCEKGDVLLITGNNVRVRNEPDLTRQNILFQVHKNYEVVQLGDKTVDGQRWYKVCYDGNIGWVSGQYAKKK